MKLTIEFKLGIAGLILISACSSKESISIKEELRLLENEKKPSSSSLQAQLHTSDPKAFTVADIETIEKDIDLTEEQRQALREVAE